MGSAISFIDSLTSYVSYIGNVSQWDKEGMALLLKARDAEVAKQARVNEAVKWLPFAHHKIGCDAMKGWSKTFGIAPKPCSCGFNALRLAITQGAQGQGDPRDAPVPFELVAAECPDRITLKVSREWWEKHLIKLNTKGEMVLRGFAALEATK